MAREQSVAERLVLGSWALGGPVTRPGGVVSYGNVPREMVFDVLDAAWASGIRWIDIAPSYGDGEAQRRIAEWQARTARRFSVIAKPGRPIVEGRPVSKLDWDSVIAEVEAMERTLDVRTILIKDPPVESFGSELSSLFAALRRARPQALIGVASHSNDALLTLPKANDGQVVCMDYSGISWEIGVDVVDALSRRGWRVWAMQPLAYGFLGGRYGAAHEFAPLDWRRDLSASDRAVLAWRARAFLGRFGGRFAGSRPAQVAIAFCLCSAGIDRVVIGPKSVDQLQSSIGSIALANSADFHDFVTTEFFFEETSYVD